MGLFSRLLMAPRWRHSRLRNDLAGLMLVVGSMLGHQPQHIEPAHPEIAEPLYPVAPEVAPESDPSSR